MALRSETEQAAETLDVVERFNEATNRHDVDGMMAWMSDDVVFESTSSPDGDRFEGAVAVRAAWEALFKEAPRARFEGEEIVVAGDRCTVRWRYVFDVDAPDTGYVRGIDLIRVADGKIVEKLAYVKG
jgi:ketosteroid isomerase-like protein